MGDFSWRRVVLVLLPALVILSAAFSAWYYIYVFSPEQTDAWNAARAQSMLGLGWKKYCSHGAPYATPAIEAFCTQNKPLQR